MLNEVLIELQSLMQRRDATLARARRLEREASDLDRQFNMELETYLEQNELKRLRGAEKQETFAAAAGSHPSVISMLENGKMPRASEQTLLRILEVYATRE